MMKRILQISGLLAVSSVSTMAVSIEPTYTTFGTLSSATFGGSGIPNNAVAISQVVSGSYNITLGLTAHQRYSNPAVGNDGAGTFYAIAGGDVLNGDPGYARWNIGLYVDFNPNLSTFSPNGYSVRLYYDLNPAVGNDVATYLTLEPGLYDFNFNFDNQNSYNLGMSIFNSGFNPNALGEYSFALAVLKDGVEIGRSAIEVNVSATGTVPTTSVPDGGSSVMILGMALSALGFVARRK